MIQKHPQLYSPHKNTPSRKRVLQRFIFYMELDVTIWIAAVAHQKPRPDYWLGRNP